MWGTSWSPAKLEKDPRDEAGGVLRNPLRRQGFGDLRFRVLGLLELGCLKLWVLGFRGLESRVLGF